MIEKALSGTKAYWIWIAFLVLGCLVALDLFLTQLDVGLGITGLSRDVPWGMYIAQLTFMVGIAASAVMVVLPYYLHNYKQFGPITVLGEFLAISAVMVCMLFVAVDMGRPDRLANLLLHPRPNSPMFWDFLSVMGYLLLNIVISFKTLEAKRNDVQPPSWLKVLVIVSIPWAFSIHTVTAFLYSGLAARPFWLSAILAPRFLASAFACGPSLLFVVLYILEKVSRVRFGHDVKRSLARIITYALAASLFFLLLEFFTVFYSDIPHHTHPFHYLLFGSHNTISIAVLAWLSILLTSLALLIHLVCRGERSERYLILASVMTLVGLWIDKGFNMVAVGFSMTPNEELVVYWPTWPELVLTFGIYSFGMLVFTLLAKIYLAYAGDLGAERLDT